MRSSAVIAALFLLLATSAMAQSVVAPSGSIGGVGSLKLGSVSVTEPTNPVTINAAAPGNCPTSPQQFEIADTTAGPLCLQVPFSAISGTASNSQLAGPLVNGVTVGVGGDFAFSKSDPLAVGNETLTPGNVTATHLSSPLPVAQGGTGDATLTAHGLLIGEGTSAVAATAAGTAGQIPVSGGAAANPSYVTPTAGTGLSVTANATTEQYSLNMAGGTCSGSTPFGASLNATGTLICGTTSVTPQFNSLGLGTAAVAQAASITGVASLAGSLVWTLQNTSNSASAATGVQVYNDTSNENDLQISSSVATPYESIGANTGNIYTDAVGGFTIQTETGAGKICLATNGHSTCDVTVSTDGTYKPHQFTVGTLPTCNAGEKGSHADVTDATACSFNAAPTGGGAVECPVFCNGTNWLGG